MKVTVRLETELTLVKFRQWLNGCLPWKKDDVLNIKDDDELFTISVFVVIPFSKTPFVVKIVLTNFPAEIKKAKR